MIRPPGTQWLLLGAGVLGLAGGWTSHDLIVYRPHLKKDLQAVLRAQVAARTIEAKATTISTQARDALDTKQETIRVRTQTITRAIPLYLPGVRGSEGGLGVGVQGPGDTVPRAGDLSLPVGFGRLFDYAALGVDPPVPAPSSEYLGRASGITLPGLAGSIAEDFGMCHAYRAEAVTWRRWYEEQARLWPSK